MDSQISKKKYQELDLSQTEGLEFFLNSVNDVYDEAVQYLPIAQKESYESLNLDDISGKEVFQTFEDKYQLIQDFIKKCLEEFILKEREIPDNLVTELQSSYNDMILLRDLIINSYENWEEETVESSPKLSLRIEVKDEKKTDVSEISDIVQKATDIIEQISAPPDTPGIVLLKAMDLYEAVKEAEMNFAGDKKDLQIAFEALERFSKIHQTEEGGEEAKPLPEEELIPRLKRKTMEIIPDDTEGEIAIFVAKEASEEIEEKQKKSTSHSFVRDDINTAERSVVAKVERTDPINEAVEQNVSPQTETKQEIQRNSLASKYLRDEKYRWYLKSNYGSLSSYDKKLSTTVVQIEAYAMDAFERWLGERFESPFAFLKDMTIAEVIELASRKDTRNILATEKIKYEAFVIWIDLIPKMQEIIGSNPQLTLGELFARWIIESEMTN
ncbi:hypothetical protein H6785_00050 [Candidatus Nomurabacteria bacterium]|nr:hypothetical protein [Candidatus Kaiserbacteria bacterium]MCB9814964.1 hypothetical protein [Candidatus Nomurabacteria bacterium]